jgi:DNA invertase Pin-like site-specific DNA recombinase
MILMENRAAQYVRMSTDMQRYSIENQSETIAVYAVRQGLTIVRSYEDAGRSGLSIERRTALQNLMRDVRAGIADFSTLLVYDVSRWGRFQDADESAYYEFICKKAGIRVEYCAEQFRNDGSLTSTLLKNVKRAMAGEFSRDLSTKVFAGQSRVVSRGFFIGSLPGYGLRRFLVDEHANRRFEMTAGQRKAITTDRVILVPGPAVEVNIVNEIYDMFIDHRSSLCRIARELNQRQVLNSSGRSWNSVAIREILTNEKYCGNAVFNRTSKKLNTSCRRNPKQEWVRAVGAFEPVVTVERFQNAQLRLRTNALAYTKFELLDSLTALWCKAGKLNALVIGSCCYSPGANSYLKHFGGLVPAYKRIGYVGEFKAGKSPQFRKSIVSEIADRIGACGGTVHNEREYSQVLVNDELVIAVVAGQVAPKCGKNQWQLQRGSRSKSDILVVVRVEDDRSTVNDFLFVPLLLMPNERWLTVSVARLKRIVGFRSPTLEPLFALCARRNMGAAGGE